MSRSFAAASIGLVAVTALAVRLWAASFMTFPQPEDVAYYVGVARTLIEHGRLTSDAIWSYATPPLEFPRPAFEIWLPMPTFLAAIPMAILGTTFTAAQWASVVVGTIVAVLAWRLGARVAASRGLEGDRAVALALGTGLTVAVSLPLVLASVEPDSTAPFAMLALAACLLMGELATSRGTAATPTLVALGVVLGLAAWTRNEAVWLALTWALLAWRLAPSPSVWARLVGIPAAVAVLVFAPWAIRDWLAFGSPLPGQAIDNALMLNGRDIFAFQDQPTLGRYLAAGPQTLIGLRWTAFTHNLGIVLLILGAPVAIVGLAALRPAARVAYLRPLLVFSLLTFAITTLIFPVVTTSGTFLHASGAVQVLLIVAALVGLDGLIAAIASRRGWTRPVAWLGPLVTVGGALLFTLALMPTQAADVQAKAARYAALPAALEAAGLPLPRDGTPVITDNAIWLAETTRTRSLALPNEPPASVLDLARRFGGARILVVQAETEGIWPEVLDSGIAGSECFQRVLLRPLPDQAAALRDVRVYRIGCP